MSIIKIPFAMVIAERPISSKASSATRTQFQERIAKEAAVWFSGQQRFSGDLYLRIVWFHKSPTKQDTDNTAKRISDALIGVIYDDDNPIIKYLIEKIHYSSGVTILSNTIPTPVYKKLVALLGQEKEHVLYLEVGQISSREFFFGPFAG